MGCRCRDTPSLLTPARSRAMSSSSPAAEMSRHEQASQLFNLKWKNYQNHLIQVFDKMLVTESFADVTLVCCDTEHETTQAIKAHKMILGASSPYFEIVFAEHPCQHPVVVMPPEVRVEELQHVLQFIYKGEVQVRPMSSCEKQSWPLRAPFKLVNDLEAIKQLRTSPVWQSEKVELPSQNDNMPTRLLQHNHLICD